MKKILLIDDNVEYKSTLTDLLTLEGTTVITSNSSSEGLIKFKNNIFDLVITDLVMDGMDGLQLVAIIKKINPFIPIIILTAKEDYMKELDGLDLGVADYIYKSVPFNVLLKRIHKYLKWGINIREKEKLISECDGILVECKKKLVYQYNKQINLTGKEYALLCFFLRNKNKIFSREEILNIVWHVNNNIISERTIDTHVRKIRVKLKISCLISIRGIGYKWFE